MTEIISITEAYATLNTIVMRYHTLLRDDITDSFCRLAAGLLSDIVCISDIDEYLDSIDGFTWQEAICRALLDVYCTLRDIYPTLAGKVGDIYISIYMLGQDMYVFGADRTDIERIYFHPDAYPDLIAYYLDRLWMHHCRLPLI